MGWASCPSFIINRQDACTTRYFIFWKSLIITNQKMFAKNPIVRARFPRPYQPYVTLFFQIAINRLCAFCETLVYSAIPKSSAVMREIPASSNSPTKSAIRFACCSILRSKIVRAKRPLPKLLSRLE